MKTSSKTRRVMLVAASVFVVALCGGWMYSRNSLFRLAEMDVQSENPELSRYLRDEMVNYLGRSLFSISLHEIEKYILQNPAVDHVSIHRRWPSKLLIEVQVRRPVALVFVRGQLWGVDREGKLVEALRDPPAEPLLKGFFLTEEEIKNGQSGLSEVFRWLDEVESRAQDGASIDASKITELVWSESKGLVVKCFELGIEVEIGTHDLISAWKKAGEAFSYLASRSLKPDFLDATYRSRVVVRMRSKLQISQNGLNLEELVRRRGLREEPHQDSTGAR